MTGRSMANGHSTFNGMGPSGGYSITGTLGNQVPEWGNGLTSPRSR